MPPLEIEEWEDDEDEDEEDEDEGVGCEIDLVGSMYAVCAMKALKSASLKASLV